MSEIKLEWKAFLEKCPEEGETVVVATVNCKAEIYRISGPCKFRKDRFDFETWSHWHPVCVVPPPEKPDYCREAWDRYNKNFGGCSVSFPQWKGVWNSAIACAKENGLENV